MHRPALALATRALYGAGLAEQAPRTRPPLVGTADVGEVGVTKIEWTEETWNPTTGCDRISPGCDHCYALTMAKRLKGMGQAKYQRDGDPRTSGPGFGLTVHPDTLTKPYEWKKPRRVFVNSMSDLFHARVPLSFVQQVFEVMADTPHTYQVLTKRASRLPRIADRLTWPPNVWMGVSVENAEHTGRIDDLRQVPAAVRFVSAEPLLGPLDDLDLTGIAWVIVGGESEHGARPMELGWARSIIGQCHRAGTAPFVKQLGTVWAKASGADKKGGDWEHWPTDLRVREYPNHNDKENSP
jgi:protein gp37